MTNNPTQQDFNWASIRFTNKLAVCTICIRDYYEDRVAKPEALSINGHQMNFHPLWLMDSENPYPGEWALGTKDTSFDLGWIASGDVIFTGTILEI